MKKIGMTILLLFFLSACSFSANKEQDENPNATNDELEEQAEENEKETDDQEETNAQTNDEMNELVEGEMVKEKDENVPPEERDLPDVPDTYGKAVDYPMTGE